MTINKNCAPALVRNWSSPHCPEQLYCGVINYVLIMLNRCFRCMTKCIRSYRPSCVWDAEDDVSFSSAQSGNFIKGTMCCSTCVILICVLSFCHYSSLQNMISTMTVITSNIEGHVRNYSIWLVPCLIWYTACWIIVCNCWYCTWMESMRVHCCVGTLPFIKSQQRFKDETNANWMSLLSVVCKQ